MKTLSPGSPPKSKTLVLDDGLSMAREYLGQSIELLEQTVLVTRQMSTMGLIPNTVGCQLIDSLELEIKRTRLISMNLCRQTNNQDSQG